MTYYPHNFAILAMDWTSQGLFTATYNQVKLYNPATMFTRLTLNFTTSQVMYAVTASSNLYIMTAVSFADRI